MSETPYQLKEWFDVERHRSVGAQLKSLCRPFDEKRFFKLTLDQLEERSLMQRMSQMATAMEACLPGSFQQQVAVLKDLAPQLGHAFICITLCDFVAKFGRAEPAFSLEALRFFTCFGSAEFAVRYFLQDDLPGTLAVMQRWTQDDNEHVRRLASEGCRPRLPWGTRLQALVQNPQPLARILEPLKADPALYVRKSVANNLNDIAKDHPDWVLEKLQAWGRQNAHTAWIAKHAARTLIKQGHPQALELFGFGGTVEVKASLALDKVKLSLGEAITLTAEIANTRKVPQTLAVDYVVHYVKANGGTSEKVFKWSELELPARATKTLQKRQTFKNFTTRKHFAGTHLVELQINGQRLAKNAFLLVNA